MNDKSARITALLTDPHRLVRLIVISFCLVFITGCASSRKSIKTMWDQVPPVRWTAKSTEPEQKETIEKPAEPQIAANVALGNDSRDHRPLTAKSAARFFAEAREDKKSIATRSNSPSALSSEETKLTSPETPPVETASDDLTPRTDSSIDRLNAALWEEAPSQTLPQKSLTALDDRLKVNALVSQAERLLEVGQIEQARQIATAAQDLGETTQVDYAPDEDRPIDLVRKIDGQLEAVRLKNESRSETVSSETIAAPQTPAIENKADTAENAAPKTNKDVSNFSRFRRDWSTLFVRDKKATPQETTPVLSDPKPISSLGSPPKGPDAAQTERASRGVHKFETREAIVVANRSVSLGTADDVVSSDESFVQVNDQLESIDSDPDNELSSADLPNSKVGELPGLLEIPLSEPTSSTESHFERDDIPEVMSDSDMAKSTASATPSTELKTGDKPSATAIPQTSDDRPQSDSLGLYIAFGLCGLLAVGYYRRGAT